MGLLQRYLAALKPLEVEEPIDVYVHRPLAYGIARLSLPTRITPDQITFAAMAVGVAGGALIAWPFPGHLQAGALCVFLSAVLDCADGMLARLRGTSSAHGRMLDGVADLVTITAVVAGDLTVLLSRYAAPPWQAAVAMLAAAAAIVTSAHHTAAYDHYKSAWLRLTTPGSTEGDDLEQARARYEAARARGMSLLLRAAWAVYLGYLERQRAWIARFDPWTAADVGRLPPYDPARAAAYRAHGAGPMRVWRGLFGVGSLMFGLAAATAVGRPDLLLALRLVVLNGVLYLYLRPAQRRASRLALGGAPPS